MGNIWKKLVLITGILVVMVCSISVTSYAYTEEEKAQAKAWLSAHGYSPDYGGAAQAYQDYLDGKFDEELGLNGGENDATTQATTEITTEEQTVHPKREKPGQAEKAARVESSDQEKNPGDQEKSGGTDTKQASAEEDLDEAEVRLDAEDDSVKLAMEESGASDREPVSRVVTDSYGYEISEMASGIYDRKNEKAVVVIAIGVVLMLLISVISNLLRNREKKEKSITEELDAD